MKIVMEELRGVKKGEGQLEEKKVFINVKVTREGIRN